MMRTQVQKWGNSLAIRVPKPFAAQAGLEERSVVDLSIVEGKLLIEPVVERSLTLEELLAGVTDENLHGEFETGPAVGNEAW